MKRLWLVMVLLTKLCVCVVNDNASNMMKTFVGLPGYTEPVMSTDSSDDDCDDDSEEGADKDTHDCLPMHLPCFGHTLQLVI